MYSLTHTVALGIYTPLLIEPLVLTKSIGNRVKVHFAPYALVPVTRRCCPLPHLILGFSRFSSDVCDSLSK